MEISKYNMLISIRAICNYEKLTSSPFTELDLTDLNKVCALIYSILISHPENKFYYSYETALKCVFSNEKIMEKLAANLESTISYSKQFGNLYEIIKGKAEDSSKKSAAGKKEKPVFIYQVIPLLVTDCGLDINYVMDQMDYTDIDIFLDHMTEQHQVKLEEDRLWTYLSILPHLNPKKSHLKKPSDLIEFEWENPEKKNQEKLKSDTEYLKSIGFKPAKSSRQIKGEA